MRVALLTNDNREIQRKYHLDSPLLGPAPEALLEGFKQLSSEVEIHVISCLQRMPAHSPERLSESIYYHPLHVPNIGWLKTGYQGCVRAVRRKIREIQPDIVHGQGTERDCAISAVLSGYPNVITIHGHMSRIAELTQASFPNYYWFVKRLERLCIGRAGGVVCLNNYTRETVKTYTSRCWMVPNAVHPSFFGLTRSLVDKPRILCSANIHPWKNQVGLIKALLPLQAAIPFELRFAGAGSPSDRYYQEFAALVGEHSWCRYLGALDRRALQQEISTASIGVLPSFEDNCPMVVLEAAAAGLPFAASRIGGIPDLISHGKTGLLFSPDNGDDIRAAIELLLVEPDTGSALGSTASKIALKDFAPGVIAGKHVDVYHSIIKGH
jgi:glycosyltransferase involved in cell wall biosynthesis